MSNKKYQGLKVLVVDVETAPIIAAVYGLFDQNIGLPQILRDTFILSWAAKWYEDESGNVYGPHKKVMYQRHSKNKPTKDDTKLAKGIWKLLDEADIIIGQNVKRFDSKKLNTLFLNVGLKRVSPYKQIDTLTIAKGNFAFTSNKLEFTSGKYCTKFQKLKHGEFPGFRLFIECTLGNPKAWKELAVYNKYDILSTEEYYQKIQAYDTSSINFNSYQNETYHHVCNCGSTSFRNKGYAYTLTGKFRRSECKKCGKPFRENKNLLDKDKRDSMKRNITK